MGSIRSFSNLSNLDFKNIIRFLANYIESLTQEFNGRIEFQTNIRSSPLLEVVFANSSDIQEISHNLGFVPRGTLNVKLNADANVYAPVGAQYTWTSEKIYLQASAAVTVKLYII